GDNPKRGVLTGKMAPLGLVCVAGVTRLPPQRNSRTRTVNHPEIIKLQKFLQLKFNNKNIDVRPRAKLNDSVEVYIGDESIGLIHVDDEDGDKSYIFNM